jgi:hypothetical protein
MNVEKGVRQGRWVLPSRSYGLAPDLVFRFASRATQLHEIDGELNLVRRLLKRPRSELPGWTGITGKSIV